MNGLALDSGEFIPADELNARWLPRKATEEEMSKEQPTALRLADQKKKWTATDCMDAAAELRRLHAENEALRAQIGQGVPVAWICEEQTIGPNYGKKRLTFSKYYSDNPLHYKHTPLYTHPAPQQRPLTDEQIVDAYCKERGMRHYVEAYVAGARFAEAAHNIGEKK